MDYFKELLEKTRANNRYNSSRSNSRSNSRNNSRNNNINNEWEKEWADDLSEIQDFKFKENPMKTSSTAEEQPSNQPHNQPYNQPHIKPYNQPHIKLHSQSFSPPTHSKSESKCRSESGYAPSIQSEENYNIHNPNLNSSLHHNTNPISHHTSNHKSNLFSPKPLSSPAYPHDSESSEDKSFTQPFRNPPKKSPSPSLKHLNMEDFKRIGSVRKIGINKVKRFSRQPQAQHFNNNNKDNNNNNYKNNNNNDNDKDPHTYWESKWNSNYNTNNNIKNNNFNKLQINDLHNNNNNNNNSRLKSAFPKYKTYHSSSDALLESHSRNSNRSNNNIHNINSHYFNNNNNDRNDLDNYRNNLNNKNNYHFNNIQSYKNNNLQDSYHNITNRYSTNNNHKTNSNRYKNNLNANNNLNSNNRNTNNLNPHTNNNNSNNNNLDNNNPNNLNNNNPNNKHDDKDFLSKVQEELEQQRMHWTPEMDRLLSPISIDATTGFSHPHPSDRKTHRTSNHPVFNAENNSYVDTSKALPVFKAFVDVSEYPVSSVRVGLDQLTNKVVVEACDDDKPTSNVAMTFTQKIPLPRYADSTNMKAQVNRKGLVKIEIPLLYYFPQDHDKHNTNHNHTNNNHNNTNHNHHSKRNQEATYGKSYVSEVKKDSRGLKVMEIVVKPGWKVGVDDVVVEVVEEKFLVVSMETEVGRKVLKTYSLPDTADSSGISSRVHDELVLVSVPVSG